MKSLIRVFVINVLAIFTTVQMLPGLTIKPNFLSLLFVSLVFTILNSFVKPLLKILFFPITLLTLGFFSWVINIGIFYLLLFFVPQIQVSSWIFQGVSYQGFSIPLLKLSPLLTIILASFIISVLSSFFRWLCGKS